MMDLKTLHDLSASEAARFGPWRNRQLGAPSSRLVWRAYARSMNKSRLGHFLTRTTRLRRRARPTLGAVKENLTGPLHGVPVGINELFDTADMPTEYGSR